MKIGRSVLLGFLVWLVLFIFSFFIFSLYETNFLLFKTIMIVSSTLVGMIALIIYFKKIEGNYINAGIANGLIWLGLNLAIDLVVLVWLFENPIGEFFIGTGLRYLNMPIMSIGAGYLLAKK